MSVDWCVLRTSLFPSDFSWDGAPEDERQRFLAAIAVASSNPDLPAQIQRGELPAVRALYEARARSRSIPRSLFAAAAIATPAGGEPSLSDVRVQRSHPLGARLPGKHPETLAVSTSAVFHADAVTVYQRDVAADVFHAKRLGLPKGLREALLRQRGGTRIEWETCLQTEGIPADRVRALLDRLLDMGVLEPPGACSLWNDEARPNVESLGEAVAEVTARQDATETPTNAFATFARPVRMPAALADVQEVAEVLLRCTRSEPPVLQRLLDKRLDGRWLPMPELERMAEGLLERADNPEFEVAAADEPFVRWLRARAFESSIDLTDAPLPASSWSGVMLLGTRWSADGRLVGPALFSAHPRELIGRYDLPGLAERLPGLDEEGTETVMLAYRGPGVLDKIADVRVPGVLALEYCGRASDSQRTLRLEDLEVSATGDRLLVRTREEQRQLRIVRPVPYDDSNRALHPLVRLLSRAATAERPGRSLLDVAFKGLPVRPRITYGGHVLCRRRAPVPAELTEDTLPTWLERVGLADCEVTVDSSSGALPLDPAVDCAARRDLFKRLRRQQRLAVSERLPSVDLVIDGRGHAAHALLPVTFGSVAKRLRVPKVPRPAPGALLGPYRTLRVSALSERMPTVLRELRESLGEVQFFYVFLSDEVESELRLRIPAGQPAVMHALMERLDVMLDQRIVRHFAVEPYVREWDRYGGAADIEAVEALFVADSASLYDACSGLPLMDDRRTNLYALAILQTLDYAGLSPDAQHAFCRRAFDSFCAEFGYSTDDRRAVGNMWRARRRALVSTAVGDGDETMHAALVQRAHHLSAWLGQDNRLRLCKHLRSVVHMTGTRLHFRHNRAEEAWALLFARNLLERWRHVPQEAGRTTAWRSATCSASNP
ncbi:MAG: thiopeptide-type bacteriocin biosynthesis protein [Nannocystales bacterium]